MVKKLADIYNRFDSIPACDRQLDDRQNAVARLKALHCKNTASFSKNLLR